MPTLQTAFTDFHDAIKLSDFDENATLREKRDILLDENNNITYFVNYIAHLCC